DCHYLLSRGAPPPLADAAVCKRWPSPMRRGPTPDAVAPRVRAPQRLKAVLQTGMAAGATYFLAGIFLTARGAPPPPARLKAAPARPPHRGCRDGDPGSLMPPHASALPF